MSNEALTSGKLGRITPDRTRLEMTCPHCESIIGIVFDRRAVIHLERGEYSDVGRCWCGQPFYVLFDAESHAVKLSPDNPVFKWLPQLPLKSALIFSRKLQGVATELIDPRACAEITTRQVFPFQFRATHAFAAVTGARDSTEEGAFASALSLRFSKNYQSLAQVPIGGLHYGLDAVPFDVLFEKTSLYSIEVIAPWDFADVSALRVSLTLSGERVE